MKQLFRLMLFFFPLVLSAQETEPIATLPNEDFQKIMRHLQSNYRVPDEVFNDTIKRIDYKVQFIINDEGRITEPEITYKTTECTACEKELMRVLKRTPAVNPLYRDDKKIKVSFIMPFVIRLE